MENTNECWQSVEIDELGAEYEDWLDWMDKEPLSHELERPDQERKVAAMYQDIQDR